MVSCLSVSLALPQPSLRAEASRTVRAGLSRTILFAISQPVSREISMDERLQKLRPIADPLTRARALIAAFTTAEKLNNTGSTSPGVPRLGLPAYTWWNEALHGVADSPGVNFSDPGTNFSVATSFPQPILMGAAFDDELIREVATVVSTEARAFNNDGRAGLDYWSKSRSIMP